MATTDTPKDGDEPSSKIYSVLLAGDVPHYGTAEIEAESDADAIRMAKTLSTDSICSEAAWDATVCKRIVHVEDAKGNVIAADIPLDQFILFNKGIPAPQAEPEYTIGINNDDGDCYDIAILRRGQPIATLIAPDTELYPLVRAGNCFFSLVAALEDMLRCFVGEYPVTEDERGEVRRNALEVIQKATGGNNV